MHEFGHLVIHKDIVGLIFLSSDLLGKVKEQRAAWPPCRKVLITVPCLHIYLSHLSHQLVLPAISHMETYPLQAGVPTCMCCTVRAGKRISSQETYSLEMPLLTLLRYYIHLTFIVAYCESKGQSVDSIIGTGNRPWGHPRMRPFYARLSPSPNIFFELWQNWYTTLYIFQLYNIVIWYLYTLHGDHHCKSNYHPSS